MSDSDREGRLMQELLALARRLENDSPSSRPQPPGGSDNPAIPARLAESLRRTFPPTNLGVYDNQQARPASSSAPPRTLHVPADLGSGRKRRRVQMHPMTQSRPPCKSKPPVNVTVTLLKNPYQDSTRYTVNKDTIISQGIINVAAVDSEAEVRQKLVAMIATIRGFEGVQADDLKFKNAIMGKLLDDVALAPNMELTGERVLALRGQGRLYVEVQENEWEEGVPDGSSSSECDDAVPINSSRTIVVPDSSDSDDGALPDLNTSEDICGNGTETEARRYHNFVGSVDEDDAMRMALQESLEMAERHKPVQQREERKVEEVQGILGAYVDAVLTEGTQHITVSREHTWQDFSQQYLRSETSIVKCTSRLAVRFTTGGLLEVGIDDGGPTRELFRVIFETWTKPGSSVLEGNPEEGFIFKKSFSHLKDMAYQHMGQAAALSLIHGGQLPAFFRPSVVDMLLAEKTVMGRQLVDEMPDPKRRDLLRVMDSALDEFPQAMETCLAWVVDGVATNVSYEDRLEWAESVADVVNLTYSPYVAQFRDGLRVFGMLPWIRQNGARRVLQYDPQNACDEVKNILKPAVRPRHGTPEHNVWKNFLTFLGWADSGMLVQKLREAGAPTEMLTFGAGITSRNVLAFATGGSGRPSYGYAARPKIQFKPNPGHRALPEAATCSCELFLYACHSALEAGSFARDLCEALMNDSFNKC